MEYYVAFDIAHKPRGKINENLTQMRDLLNSNDLLCYEFLETPITEEVLNRYDILVFVCPDFAKISHQEILEIENWVRTDGGGLLLLSHAGGDKGRNSNLSELAERFGIAFESDQVLDEENNLGLENRPLVTNFNPPHPITEGIDSLCYRAGCSLSIMGDSYSIAVSNETSDPFSCPLICVAEPDHGRVCAIGSYEMFRDETSGGFDYGDHSKLLLNIFNWLVSDYRQDLREGNYSELTPGQEGQAAAHSAGDAGQKGHSFEYDEHVPEIDVAFRISEKSDLMHLLKNFLAELNTMKGVVEQVIEKASVSDEEILNLQQMQQTQTQQTTQQQEAQTYNYEDYEAEAYNEPLQNEEVTQEGSSPANQPAAGNSNDLHTLKEPPLSALPPRPDTLAQRVGTKGIESEVSSKVEEPSTETSESDMEGLGEDFDDLMKKEEKPEKEVEEVEEEDEEIDIEELKTEKESLESKLNSNNNLLNFLDKQKKSGAVDKKKHKKQTDRLKRDVKKIKKRIKEIDVLLEEG